MNRHSNFHIFGIVLCVLALFVAQTFGGPLRYLCDCGGRLVQTQSSHCHGPHDAHCHEDEMAAAHAQGEENSGERKDHQVVKNEVQLLPVKAAPQIIAPQMLLAILPMVETLIARDEANVSASCRAEIGESPPFGVMVARTIVLRI